MSAREEQPATVPPPAGEDDAYSATTKVGAMPPDIMEKLRAEGLLPEDVEKQDRETPVTSIRPSTSLEKRSVPSPEVRSTPPVSDGAPVPQLYSTAPPAMEATPESKMVTVKPPPPASGQESSPPPADASAPAIETPVAFAFPPIPPLPKLGSAMEARSEERPDTTRSTPQKPTTQAPSKTTMAVVAAVVVLLLIVALMRLRG